MNDFKIKIILGSTRQGRASEHVGAWLLGEVAKTPGVEVELLDLRDYPMPFFDQQETPGYKSKPYTEPMVVKWTAKIAEADAFIIIAPEYNHGYPAVLKNAIDWVGPEWNKKPVTFVSYGSALGARSVEQLREVAVELQMAPIRLALHMSYEVPMAVSKGTPPSEAFAPFVPRISGIMEQLLWWARALKAAREQ